MGSGNGYFRTPEGWLGDLDDQLDEVRRRLVIGPPAPEWPAAGTIRTAFLPATYRGWGPTNVVIDGVLSLTAYNWGSPYVPNAARMVRLVSDGTTWIIMGQISDETIYLPYDSTKMETYGERAVDSIWNLRPRATKLALSGLVVLSGMMISVGTLPNGSVIGTLPVGMRPPFILAFTIEYGDNARTLYIHPNGDLALSAPPGATQYISLDGIAFHPAGVGTWTEVGQGGSSYTANFENWTNPAFGTCQFYKDPWGFVWWRGLIRLKVATSSNGTLMINMPATHRSHITQHFRTVGVDTHAGIYGEATTGIAWMSGSPGAAGDWVSLTGAVNATADSLTLNPWKTIKAWANGWIAYPAFPVPGYTRRADGLVMLKGLTNGTTVNTKQAVMTEEETWPAGGRLIIPAVSNQARGRLDVFSARDNEAATAGTPGSLLARSASAAWFSWDGLKWLP
jgi:hypothetical protein